MSMEFTIVLAVVIAVTVLRSLIIRGNISWSLFRDGVEPGAHLSVAVATLSIFASLTGSFLIFGIVQLGVEAGLTGYFLGLAYLIGLPVLVIAMKSFEKQISTSDRGLFFDQLFETKYGCVSKKMFLILTVLLFGGVLAGQFLAIKAYLEYFTDIGSLVVVLVIGCIGTISYTVRGGLRAVIANDVLQAILVLLVSVIIPFSIYSELGKVGEARIELMRPGIGGKYGTMYPLLAMLFLIPSFLVRADIWQRLLPVETKKRWRVLVGVALMLAWFYGAMTTAGVLVGNHLDSFSFLKGASVDSFVPRLVDNLVREPIVKVLCLSGILLAVLSSIDSYLNLVSVCFTRLLLGDDMIPTRMPSEKERLRNARVVSVGVALCAIVIAGLLPDLVVLLSASFSLIGILLPVAAAALLVESKMPDWVGWVPLAAGILCLIIAIPIVGRIAFLPAIVVSVVSLIITYFTYRNAQRSRV